jgi:hypothetical protein
VEKIRVEILIEASNSEEAQSIMRAWKHVLESLRTSQSVISILAGVK